MRYVTDLIQGGFGLRPTRAGNLHQGRLEGLVREDFAVERVGDGNPVHDEVIRVDIAFFRSDGQGPEAAPTLHHGHGFLQELPRKEDFLRFGRAEVEGHGTGAAYERRLGGGRVIVLLRRIGNPPDPEHLRGIAPAQFPVSGRIEMQEVEVLRASVGIDGMGRRDHPVQRVDERIVRCADAAPVRRDYFPGEERNVLGPEVQVPEEVLIDRPDVLRPRGVAGIGLALVHQDAGDDPFFLRNLSHGDQPVVGTAPIGRQHGLHPLRRRLRIGVDAVRKEAVDADTAHSHMDDAHPVVFRQIRQQRPPEIIGGRQARVLPAQRGDGLVPSALLPGLVGEIHGRKVQEPVGNADGILRLDPGVSFHVGLPEAEEDMEILVLGRCRDEAHGCQQ